MTTISKSAKKEKERTSRVREYNTIIAIGTHIRRANNEDLSIFLVRFFYDDDSNMLQKDEEKIKQAKNYLLLILMSE